MFDEQINTFVAIVLHLKEEIIKKVLIIYNTNEYTTLYLQKVFTKCMWIVLPAWKSKNRGKWQEERKKNVLTTFSINRIFRLIFFSQRFLYKHLNTPIPDWPKDKKWNTDSPPKKCISYQIAELNEKFRSCAK